LYPHLYLITGVEKMATEAICGTSCSFISPVIGVRTQRQQSLRASSAKLRRSSFVQPFFRSSVASSPLLSLQRLQAHGARCVAETAQKEAVRTKVKRNVNLGKLQAGYLFPEVNHIPLPLWVTALLEIAFFS
jgi:hypothetical protein